MDYSLHPYLTQPSHSLTSPFTPSHTHNSTFLFHFTHSLSASITHSPLVNSLTHSFNRSFLTSPTYSLWQLLTQQPLELLYGQNGVVLRAVVKVVRHFGHVPRHRPAQRNPDRLTGRRLDRLQEERAGSGQENRT